MSNTNDEREKMYIISRLILHPTELVIPSFESLVEFARETKGEAYEPRLAKLKEIKGYYKAWDTWLEVIYSLDSLNSGGEYDSRFVAKDVMERVKDKIEQEWSEACLK